MGRILVIAAAGMMLLGACGGDDDEAGDGDDGGGAGDGRTQEYVEAVSASIREDDETGVAPEQADCMGAAIVDVVGADALAEAGISPDEFGDADDLASLDVDLPNDAGDRLGAALGECDLAGSIKDVLVEGFTSELGTELPPDAVACLSDNLDDRAVTDALARMFVDGSDEQVQEALRSAVAACPPVMTAVLVAEMPPGLPPSAEACVTEFVESNADLVAGAFTSGSSDAGEEVGAPLAAACPEVAAAVGR